MAIDYSVLAIPKGEPRARTKRRLTRKEQIVKRACRQHCVDRDGFCRCDLVTEIFEDMRPDGMFMQCDGPSEWAHLHARRRSKTRGMDPTVRHDTKYSLMLCKFHHQLYDAKKLIITALSRRGANGPLKFRLTGGTKGTR